MQAIREIKVRENNGRCLIRFTYQGKQYNLTQGNYADKAALKVAQHLANKIYLDCLSGNFDKTLSKYKPQTAKTEEQAKCNLAELMQRRLAARYSQSDYALTKLLQIYAKPVQSEEDAKAFMEWLKVERGLAASTMQRYLNSLRVVARQWFTSVAVTVPSKPMPKPFSKDEIRAILESLKGNRYYKHYHDYVYCLFSTGARTSEIIGLRWCDIDFAREEIHIYESLARFRGSSSKRERKTTKTNKARIVPCKNGLKELLLARKPINGQPNDLVFLSPEGFPIDDHNFSQRCWKFILRKLAIEQRPPYNCRHTFISHCLEAGMNPVKVAAITGHDVKTLLEKYAGVIDKIEIPELF